MTPDDVPALLRVFGDAEVMRFYPATFDETRMQRWVAWNQQHDAEHGHGLWAVILRATGECIGDCGLVPQQVDGVAEIEIGYHLRRDLWCQGLATEAHCIRLTYLDHQAGNFPNTFAFNSEVEAYRVR